jgi:hypothetical protein
MGKITEALLNGLTKFVRFLFVHFYELFGSLWKAKDGIPFRYLIKDFWEVLRSAGMFTVFNVLALFVFTALPQGKDVLLIIVEDILTFHVWNLIWLLIGVVFWSIVSEYGTRYSIYVTDISGRSLSDERVVWRKTLQQAVAEIFLALPYLIVIVGFLINYLQDTSFTDKNDKRLGYGIPVVCVYLVFNVISRFYYDRKKRAEWRENLKGWKKIALIPLKEIEWCNKLYGIYNDYVFSIRRHTNFTKLINGPLRVFTENFSLLPDNNEWKINFPKDSAFVTEKTRVPQEFVFKEFTSDGEHMKEDRDEGSYKWVYEIPTSFYRTLHLQLKIIAIVSLVLFFIICFLPVQWYTYIGAPGLVVIAFGCWSGIYIGMLYLDFASPYFKKFSLRFLLFILLILCSFFNTDHPVRYNEKTFADYKKYPDTISLYKDNRPYLKDHFFNWFEAYKKDTTTLYCIKGDTSKLSFYPVIFVCAEGGALRTGAFASQTLSFLQDSLQKNYGLDFKKSVYAFSGVSGGSVGISFFNALGYLSKPEELRQESYSDLTKRFFNEDFLSPVIGKMFYGDVVQLILPFHVQKFDRAIGLEKSWEFAYERVINPKGENIFSADFKDIYNRSAAYPALFINTDEVETGRQCWITNVRPDSNMFFSRERDLISQKIRGGINYSTAINFSSRFPLFSPAGTLQQGGGKKFHYVDGGYVENTGAGTMLEVLKSMKPYIDTLNKQLKASVNKRVRPYVIVLQYAGDGVSASNINFGNEVSEILLGIYNTRNGRSKAAITELERFVEEEMGGKVSKLPLSKSGSDVPLNWVLSAKSLNSILADIKDKWEEKGANELQQFFAFDTTCVGCGLIKDYFKNDTVKTIDAKSVKIRSGSKTVAVIE